MYLQHMRSLSPPDGSGLGLRCSAAPRARWPRCGPVASSLTRVSGCWFADECFSCWFGLKEEGTSKRKQLSVQGRQKMRKDGWIDPFLQLSLDMTSLALCREKPFLVPVISHSYPNSGLDTLKSISYLLKNSRTQISMSVLGNIFVQRGTWMH